MPEASDQRGTAAAGIREAETKIGNKEFNARHILVATEEEAKAIIAQLGKKAKFEKLAEKSLDAVPPNRAVRWLGRAGQLRRTLRQRAAEPAEGRIHKEPVESQFGWHVIKLDDVRELKVPVRRIKPQLQQRLQQQSIQKAITDLKAQARSNKTVHARHHKGHRKVSFVLSGYPPTPPAL